MARDFDGTDDNISVGGNSFFVLELLIVILLLAGFIMIIYPHQNKIIFVKIILLHLLEVCIYFVKLT